ncbi:MAG TPA: hypothetical protein VD994_01720 [Prosthecobacter sp.]|nr:hypothetical protein [Prosthecobacter sp.]
MLATAGIGDAQIRTDHPWYPGELAISTFERLFATQTEQYRRATGIDPKTAEDRALASWFFRNTHYAHGEEGGEDWWGEGFDKGGDTRQREYWTGLFAHGFGLCGTTHSQWTAELQALLGHGRARGVGVAGHNSLEVFLTGGHYGSGRWAMLDHDLSTVIFNDEGSALLGLDDISKSYQTLAKRDHAPQRQRGWLVCGLHPGDGHSYASYSVAEYHAGYAGPPPMVHLRRGEKLRRYFEPGLEDGATFVFWGRNYKAGGIPGPERPLTWVNQPEAMHGSKTGTRHQTGQARYANAVYTYRPDFSSGAYKEGVVSEGEDHVTLEFYTPYIIAATPPNDSPWGIYENGCRNGLVINGKADCAVAISTDGGATWREAGALVPGLDLTDHVKGYRQYHLRFGSDAKGLMTSGLTITTVCQAAVGVLPRLKDGGTRIDHAISGRALVSAGPTKAQAQARLAEGAFGTPKVAFKLATPRGAPVRAIHAAAHVASSTPPDPEIAYQIEFSQNAGKTWQPIVRDWRIVRQGNEPRDFWSQSLCYGSIEIPEGSGRESQVRFRNNGGKRYLRAEVHLEYEVPKREPLRVTYAWRDHAGAHQQTHVFSTEEPWRLATGTNVETHWVDLEPAQP